jgi:uncharacterized protein Usg
MDDGGLKPREAASMAQLGLQLKDYRLTTAEILYFLPDYQELLQTYIWQDYDIAPKFPVLSKFLKFWEREIEGRLHSVRLASAELITPGDWRWTRIEFKLH